MCGDVRLAQIGGGEISLTVRGRSREAIKHERREGSTRPPKCTDKGQGDVPTLVASSIMANS